MGTNSAHASAAAASAHCTRRATERERTSESTALLRLATTEAEAIEILHEARIWTTVAMAVAIRDVTLTVDVTPRTMHLQLYTREVVGAYGLSQPLSRLNETMHPARPI